MDIKCTDIYVHIQIDRQIKYVCKFSVYINRKCRIQFWNMKKMIYLQTAENLEKS